MVRTKRQVIWDIKKLRASVPITKDQAEAAKKNPKLGWEFRISNE